MTEEERMIEEERLRKAREAQQGSALDGISGFVQMIIDAIKGFFDFLTNASEGTDVGDGDGREILQPGGTESLFNGIKASAVSAATWARYQQEHAGEQVKHRSPLAGKATAGDDRHMREKHPVTGDRRMHHGIDFPSSQSSSDVVMASEKGIVIFSGTLRGYGQTVIVGHADGSYSLYAHLTGVQMPSTQTEVQQGQQIGVMGATGGVDGKHLHYEQRMGSQSIVPVIEGQKIARGITLQGGGATHALAALVDAHAHGKLPVSHNATPRPLVFSAASSKAGSAHIS